MNWSELIQGDRLYVLIPYKDNDFTKCLYQESEVISIKSTFNKMGEITIVCVRFKYTDNHGKRVRKNFTIYNIDNPLATDLPFDTDGRFNKMYISYDKSILEAKYKELLDDEIRYMTHLTDNISEYIDELMTIKNQLKK